MFGTWYIFNNIYWMNQFIIVVIKQYIYFYFCFLKIYVSLLHCIIYMSLPISASPPFSIYHLPISTFLCGKNPRKVLI